MSSVSAPALILWDIDNTLVSIKGVSREIYARAFERVVGKPMIELADMAGRTERAILTETLRLNDVNGTYHAFDAFYAALGEAAEELAGRMRESGTRLPGAPQAIEALARDGVVQSVVTGNIRSIAATKLRAFELTGDHLDLAVGGYGDDGSDRSRLVGLACDRAEEKYGHPFDRKRVIVIGDTPHDIRGAHDAGTLAVGVATGSSTLEELRVASADAVLVTLVDTDALASTIFGKLLRGY